MELEHSGSHYLWMGRMDYRMRPSMATIDRQGERRFIMVYRPIWLDYWGVKLAEYSTDSNSLHLAEYGADSRTLRLKRVCLQLRCVGPQHWYLQAPERVYEKHGLGRGRRKTIRAAFLAAGTAGQLKGCWWDAGQLDSEAFSPPHMVVAAMAAQYDVTNLVILAAWSEMVEMSLRMRGEYTRKDRAICLYEKEHGVKIR